MRKILLANLVLALTYQAYAQDKIEYLTGKITECEVTEITDKNIKFRILGEKLVNSALKEDVKTIEFSSGETRNINDAIVVTSELDWEKVKVLFDNSGMGALLKGEDMSVIVTKRGVFSSNKSKARQDALVKLRKEAAKLGYPFVLVKSIDTDELEYSKRRHYSIRLNATGYSR